MCLSFTHQFVAPMKSPGNTFTKRQNQRWYLDRHTNEHEASAGKRGFWLRTAKYRKSSGLVFGRVFLQQ